MLLLVNQQTTTSWFSNFVVTMFLRNVVLIMLSLFDKFKRDNFWGPFLKALGGSTKISIYFYPIEQFLFYFDNGFHDLDYEKLTKLWKAIKTMTI